MNNFTKEELKKLLLRSFSWVSYPENQNKEELELINKIKSMIDNYCEHDWVHSYKEKEYDVCSKCAEEL